MNSTALLESVPLRLIPGIEATLQQVSNIACVAACVVRFDHPDYQGHFDERPVLPACSQFELLEALARAAFGSCLRFAGVPRCKFLGIISPGDVLTVDIVRSPNDAGLFEFSIVSQGGPRARGEIRFETPPRFADIQ